MKLSAALLVTKMPPVDCVAMEKSGTVMKVNVIDEDVVSDADELEVSMELVLKNP